MGTVKPGNLVGAKSHRVILKDEVFCNLSFREDFFIGGINEKMDFYFRISN